MFVELAVQRKRSDRLHSLHAHLLARSGSKERLQKMVSEVNEIEKLKSKFAVHFLALDNPTLLLSLVQKNR